MLECLSPFVPIPIFGGFFPLATTAHFEFGMFKMLFTKFGHGSRPFALELNEGKQMIFTGGMDNYICIWRWSSEEKSSCVEMNGLFLERKVDICWATGGGGTIRSILALECDREVPKRPFDLLVGSERGSLFAVSLSADLQPLSCPIEAKKVNAFAFIRIRGILYLISLDTKRMFGIERIDSRTDVDAGEETDLAEHFRLNFSDCNGRPMVFRPDMFYYSNSARSLALCTESDRSLHLAIFGNRSFCFTHHIIGAPIDQFLWVQPESCQLFLSIGQNGQVTVYRIGKSSSENDSHRSLLTVSQFLLSNNKCGNEDENKVAKVQVALLIAETPDDVPTVGVLLLGTRSGTLMAFSLQSGRLLLLNRLAHGTNGCAKTVTALHIEAIQNSKKAQIEGDLISTGRDGTMKKWHFHWTQKRSLENVVEKFSLDSFFVRQLPIEWPCAIVQSDNSRAFIVGFHSNEFVMMDFESLFILATFRCGGGNRKWQFIVGTGGKETDRKYSFAYICKGFLNFVLLDPVEFHPIRSSLHSDNIVTMTSLEHRGTVFLITKRFVPRVRCVDSSNVHRSNLECIYVVDNWHLHDEANGSGRDNDDRLILSVGGRSEICAWKLHFDADNETTNEVLPQLHFLSSIDLSDDSERSSEGPSPQDCRLMAVHLLNDQFLAILCSDGTIRIVQFHRRLHHAPISPRPNNWTIRLPSLAMFTSLELIKHNKVLFCTSTDGHLHAFATVPMLQQYNVDFDAEASFEERAHFCQQQFSPFLVEHCGLSALTIAPFSEYDVIFIGSESGRVNVLKHRSNRGTCQNEAMVELVTRGDWHASTVTALQTVTCPFPSSSQCPTLVTVLSTSLDCRLGVVHYDLIRQELRPLRNFPLCVSDPAALLVLPTHSPLELNCFVSGYGIEHIHLNIEHNDEYEKRCAFNDTYSHISIHSNSNLLLLLLTMGPIVWPNAKFLFCLCSPSASSKLNSSNFLSAVKLSTRRCSLFLRRRFFIFRIDKIVSRSDKSTTAFFKAIRLGGFSLAFVPFLFRSAQCKHSIAQTHRRLSAESDGNASPASPTVSELWSIVRPYLGWLLLSIIASAIIAYLNIRIPVLLGQLVNQILRVDRPPTVAVNFTMFRPVVLRLVMAQLGQAIATFVCITALSWMGERMSADLRTKLFSHLLRFPMHFFDTQRSGELSDCLNHDVQEFKSSFKLCAAQGLRTLAQTIGCAVSLWFVSPQMTLLTLGVVHSVIFVGAFFGSLLRRLSFQSQTQSSVAAGVSGEALQNIRTVKMFAMEEAELGLYRTEVQKARSLGERLGVGIAFFQALSNLFLNGIVLGVLYGGGQLVAGQQLSPGDLMSFMATTQIIQRSVAQFSLIFGNGVKAWTSCARILEFLRIDPNFDNHLSGTEQIPKHSLIGDIRLHNIHFSYPNRREKLVLEEIDLHFASGQTTAICGPSGAGKSTIAALVERLYEPQNGQVTLDGRDLRLLDPLWLRQKAIGVISQEPILFSTSIRENIRYGRPNATETEIRTAAKLANASEFIEQFPNDYDTLVGERGATLSGGQKQRIAIARALIKDPPILILDEATSALDAESERAVQQALGRLMRDRTVIIIAHRLSTIRNADKIYVLRDGRMVEKGTHDQLVRNKRSLYHAMVSEQHNPRTKEGEAGLLKRLNRLFNF
uniref:Mitochondrial potassium channel ATP-binding subunit n=1 Tax=Globodera rostochiensis TaxID=31243 RepID=A0A914H4J0_GLORO